MPCVKVVVNLPDAAPYSVRIGENQLDGLGKRVADCLEGGSAGCTALVITGSNVGPLYLGAVSASLKAAGLRVVDITVPAGEENKSAACVSEIWTAMAQSGLDERCVVVALGGGVVCDLASFVAATYRFGVPLVLVPTSLSAMANASFCSMAGINVVGSENAVGVFAQPAYVCASTDVLATLPDVEWARGCDEIANIAYADEGDFAAWHSENAEALSSRTQDEAHAQVVQDAIVRSVVSQANALAAD